MLDFLNTLFRSLSPLWEMSLTAAYAAALLIILRLILKRRAPRQILCLLWLVVFARLLIPVSLESPLSIVPEARPVQAQVHPGGETVGQFPENPATPTAPVQNPAQGQNPGTAANPVSSNPNPGEPTLTPPEGVHPDAPQPEAPAPFPWQAVLAGVWLVGAAAMAGCGLISYLRLRRRLFDAIRAPDGAWEHPAVDSPFILGMLRPRIYLPAGLTGRPRQFILCHERAHLRRLDHIVKPVCWAALALHWFNPLVWAAYLLMSRDIEAACDEAVIRRLGSQVKADYSTTLLALATGRRLPAPSPLAFDEGDAKGRIKNVLGYRRPALWVIVVSAVMAVMAAVCLLTDPVAAEPPEDSPDPGPTASASQPPEADFLATLLDPWMKEVLDGERQFISAYSQYAEGNGRTYGIHQLNALFYWEPVNTTVEVGRVAIIDLDRDGINELVIWPEGEDEYLYSVVGYVILRRQGDEVYGSAPGYRSFGDLKSDGTFTFSSSADNWGIMTASFLGGRFELSHDNAISWCEADGGEIGYYVDGRKATKVEFHAAYEFHAAKPDPAWYVYKDGKLTPYLPAGAELLAGTGPDSAGTAKLWTGEYDHPWLEWNGTVCQLMPTITAEMLPYLFVQDFDGDGQNELVIRSHLNYFGTYDVYEWNNGQVTYADSFNTQDDLLLRFNQNNVAAYSKNTRKFSVTYAHTEGDPDSEDYYRHYVTGSTTLPINFFDGFEHIRDGYPHAYANDFRQISLNPEDNSFLFELLFCPADETMKDLIRVVEPDTAVPDEHYMKGRAVGTAAFTLRYNGAKWVLEEPDRLSMGTGEEAADPYSIYTAAPLSAPVLGPGSTFPEDRDEWYKVAELPDDLIWMYARNYGQETLIRWDGNFYKVFDHVAHTPHCEMPQLKKLGGPDAYGPLAVISQVDSGSGCFGQELVVYDLDAADAVDYSHDWGPLAEDFNSSFSYQYDRDTRVLTCTYAGQTLVKTLTGDPSDDEDITRLSISGEQVHYSFDETNDGRYQLRLGVQAFVDGNVTSLFPVSVAWTLQFNGKGFDVVPGSCVLS